MHLAVILALWAALAVDLMIFGHIKAAVIAMVSGLCFLGVYTFFQGADREAVSSLRETPQPAPRIRLVPRRMPSRGGE